MSNPRFFKVANDDMAWVYDTDKSDLGPIIDPDKWFDENIAQGTCGRPRNANMQVFRAGVATSDNKVQYIGICGTPLMIMSGFAAEAKAFFDARRAAFDRIVPGLDFARYLAHSSSEDSILPSFATMKESRELAVSFFQGLDERLATTQGRQGGLDFCFLREEQQMYIHLDLGSDQQLAHEFHTNSSNHEAFADWLMNSEIERNLLVIPPRNSPLGAAPIEMSSTASVKVVVNKDFPPVSIELLSTCPVQCVYRACSLSAGSTDTPITEGIEGEITVTLEVQATKSYCDEPSGGPCQH